MIENTLGQRVPVMERSSDAGLIREWKAMLRQASE
jgi:hypothetical protein